MGDLIIICIVISLIFLVFDKSLKIINNYFLDIIYRIRSKYFKK